MISKLTLNQFTNTMQKTNINIDSIVTETRLPSIKYADNARDRMIVNRIFSEILLHVSLFLLLIISALKLKKTLTIISKKVNG